MLIFCIDMNPVYSFMTKHLSYSLWLELLPYCIPLTTAVVLLQHHVVCVPPSGRYTQDEDQLILEDELQRIFLKCNIDVHAMATGGLEWMLTHCGLVKPYGGIDLGQHWFR